MTQAQHLVCQWLRDWEECIRERDVERARLMFDLDIVSFGTTAVVALGLDELDTRQWRRTWPFIENFRFDRDTIRVVPSPDGLLATVALTWSSSGMDENRVPFDRPGRATLVLKRSAAREPWRAVHTHFSLAPGVPDMTRS